MTRILRVAFLVSCAVLAGCPTTSEIRSIVGETNAAMISPYLHHPKESSQPGWQDAIERMDKVIQSRPNDKILVNHLRVRQAMLLTVNKQDSLADQRWKLVEEGELKNERENTFYDLRDTLVWAYKNLPALESISEEDRNTHRDAIDTELKEVKELSLRILLHTIRAEIELKYTDTLDEEAPAEKAEAEKILAEGLATYVGTFSPDDTQWVQDNYGGNATGLEKKLQGLRHRSWLRSFVKKYDEQAKDRGFQPKWSPPWVATLLANPGS